MTDKITKVLIEALTNFNPETDYALKQMLYDKQLEATRIREQQELQNIRDRIECLQKENELLQEKNDILKKRNDNLKKNNDILEMNNDTLRKEIQAIQKEDVIRNIMDNLHLTYQEALQLFEHD